jgi:hypothetical protein
MIDRDVLRREARDRAKPAGYGLAERRLSRTMTFAESDDRVVNVEAAYRPLGEHSGATTVGEASN